MSRYDPDRIAALAAGSLDPAEAAAFEAEIATDPRAAAELAAQRLALGAIRRAPAPILSADERTELRRAVAAALHLDESPALVAAAATNRRRVPWRPLAVAATALAALVAAVPLFGLLSVGGDESAGTTAAFAATTTLAADAAAAGEYNLTSEDSSPEAATLGGTIAELDAPQARAFGQAEKAVADLIADPGLLFGPAPADPIPCLDEAQILLQTADPSGARLALEWGDLAVWFLSDDGTTPYRLVALDPITCEFLAAYP
jgi:anti-sigma factor RsiW